MHLSRCFEAVQTGEGKLEVDRVGTENDAFVGHILSGQANRLQAEQLPTSQEMTGGTAEQHRRHKSPTLSKKFGVHEEFPGVSDSVSIWVVDAREDVIRRISNHGREIAA